MALSFDDGPDQRCTPQLLETLETIDATATFFVVGEQIRANPGLVREIAERGHELGLHGMTHCRHDRLGAASARRELSQGLATIEEATGRRPRLYRPPYGASSAQLASICAELELKLSYWTEWGQDWEPISARQIADIVLRDLTAGSVILLHDSALYAEREDPQPTVDAIPLIAAAVRQRDLDLVSIGVGLDGDAN